jgi:hypothetical protein
MHVRWQADVNHIDLWIGEEIINLIIFAYVRKVFETAAGSKVTLNAGPIAFTLFLVACADCDNLTAGDFSGRIVVDGSHKADPNNTDS